MGANTYLKSVTSFGYKTAATGTAIQQNIDPKAGQRITIRAFGFSCGATITSVYFMQSLGDSTIANAVASNATSGFVCTAEPTSDEVMASKDIVCIELDNGKFQYDVVASGTWSCFDITSALEDTVAAGNRIFQFGVHTDDGHLRFKLTVSVQTTKELDGGIFRANAMNKPMIAYHVNDTTTVSGSQDYISVDYINV